MKWLAPILELLARAWGFVATWLWAKGEAKNQAEKANAKAAQTRFETDDRVVRLSPDTQRSRLRTWARPLRGLEDDTADER